jgi:endonuclease/exonuclease/phosphatase family metal-dependent hydrolase
LLANTSGLLDARTTALATQVAVNDKPTTTDPGIPSVITEAGIPIVIDYAFFSSSFTLREYEVMYGDNYDLSDHRPVRIVLEYFK